MSALVDSAWAYNAYQWSFCAVAVVTTSGRLFIRYRQFGRFQADDAFNGLAVLTLIGYATVYNVYDCSNSVDEEFYLRLELALDMLFWATLYLVKASLLALIWTIFKISTRFKTAWWIVTIYTFLSSWGVFLSELWQCGNPSTYDSAQDCEVEGAYSHQVRLRYIRLALHISSDCFIFILPLIQIRKMHMPFSKKISAAAVFGLTIVDIVAGIARNIAAIFANSEGGTALAYLIDIICTVIEPTIAVIVCSLPAYRALVFKIRSRRSNNAVGVHGKSRLPRKLHLLTASISSPHLEITILREPTTQIIDGGSEDTLVEPPEMVHVPEGEGEKRP